MLGQAFGEKESNEAFTSRREKFDPLVTNISIFRYILQLVPIRSPTANVAYTYILWKVTHAQLPIMWETIKRAIDEVGRCRFRSRMLRTAKYKCL